MAGRGDITVDSESENSEHHTPIPTSTSVAQTIVWTKKGAICLHAMTTGARALARHRGHI
ncbi:hypothetical protein HBI56_208990 [Parastagonospora nodorum]|uniref:Uncharacterized protein n=1 Tax=Phaeosphaeria nodorum (strain SN15 / ATCC MYA-4574 / FGSC 10173) TaxID=321614 RepID=A0A7U2F9L0_PHANO|nr:hypothetical protein HBH56_219810 [Parastagonospora nodorum]QRD01217.1 hypothetical protein JI435_157420 [Parastagonospora nodorum SN15]KAH3922031.1 hypothetical protein HBH54_229940 [Parastagonospora nodorum]KAH3941329.1 hypothetical protein HBH53_203810 [Parastagonospora nodorum]KAH3958670.1 hypothetical protein HBH51_207090 [Parastagonospora nodorum]